MLIVNGDKTAEIQAWIDNGWITSGDTSIPVVLYDADTNATTLVSESQPSVTIPVDPNGDIAAANELAQPGDTIEIAAGTYILTSQIEIKDGVTYQGAGAGLTIIRLAGCSTA